MIAERDYYFPNFNLRLLDLYGQIVTCQYVKGKYGVFGESQ